LRASDGTFLEVDATDAAPSPAPAVPGEVLLKRIGPTASDAAVLAIAGLKIRPLRKTPMLMKPLVAAAFLLCLGLQGYAAWQRRSRPWGFQLAQASVSLIALFAMLWVMFYCFPSH
jgi:hypothetical protein